MKKRVYNNVRAIATKLKVVSILFLLSCANIHSQTWIPQGHGMLPIGYEILSISVVDDTVVWVCASRASDVLSGQPVSGLHLIKVLRSVNSGDTWTSENVSESIGRISFELEAIDANTAWLTTQDYNSGRGRVLYKTEDGGMSWTPKLMHRAAGVFVDVLDDSHIYCQNTHLQGWSEDGGETWSLDTIDGFGMEEYTVLASGNNMSSSIGDTVWVGTTLGNVIRITDSGASNEIINVGFECTIHSVSFLDRFRGMLIYTISGTFQNGLLRTFDGGNSWESTPAKPQTPLEYNITYVPGTEQTFIAVSDVYTGASEYYWTTNFGDTWESGGVIANANTNAIAFTSPTTGWVTTGIIARDNQPIVYKWSGDVLSGVRDELKPLDDFSLYPNPVVDIVHYDFKDDSGKPHWLSITDAHGRMIMGRVTTDTEANISHLPAGVYFLHVQTDTQVGVRKFVKVSR